MWRKSSTICLASYENSRILPSVEFRISINHVNMTVEKNLSVMEYLRKIHKIFLRCLKEVRKVFCFYFFYNGLVKFGEGCEEFKLW